MYRSEIPAAKHIVGRECCLREYEKDPPDRTAPHGEWILDIASYYAPDSSFYTYLAAKEQQRDDEENSVRISQMAFARAVTAAIEDGIDLLNVSAGRSTPNCTHGECTYCSEARRAIRNGITVIAAAGNHPDDVVHCPSNALPAVSVGGVEIECTYSMPRIPNNPTGNPPQAYWTKLWSGYEDYPESAADGIYCTTRDCWVDSGDCTQYMEPTVWDRDPIPSGEKPDILSPLHYAREDENGYPFVWAASSFAAPVVTGCLSGTLSTLDTVISPPEIRSAVREGATHLDSAPANIFDSAEARRLLQK